MGHSIAILDDYQSVALRLADWSKISSSNEITVFTTAIPDDKLLEALSQYDVIVAMRERTKFPRRILEKLPNLRHIATTGMRNRGIDINACRELGIVVSGTLSDANAASGTVEQAWALILSLSRRLVLERDDARSGGWQSGIATALKGKQLGLVGVGRLGKQVAAVGTAFGIKVMGWSPHLDEARAKDAGVELAPSLDSLLSTCDVVSLHLVASPTTIGIIGFCELALLKRTAFLVNTSRGPLIDETALLEMLQSADPIAGVGLDVFDIEPLPLHSPFRTLDRVVMSPHMGYVDDTSYNSWWPQLVENVESYLAGNPIRLIEAEGPGIF